MATAGDSVWVRIVKAYERFILCALIAFLMILIFVTTLELGWLLVRDLFSPGVLLLDVDEMFEIFGFFLLVLIGVELIMTLKSYLREGVVHVEVVLEVALTALAQKLIILDTKKTDPLALLGVAAVIVAVALAFWLVRTAQHRKTQPRPVV